jgi:site-specific recombinase XerD
MRLAVVLAAWLNKYLVESHAGLLGAANQPLFVTDWGEPVSQAFVADAMRRVKTRADADKSGAAHPLRHACATHMLDGGADVRHVRALLWLRSSWPGLSALALKWPRSLPFRHAGRRPGIHALRC